MKTLYTILLLLTAGSLFAQGGNVLGIVSDLHTDQGLEYATISFYHTADSSLAKEVVSRKDGKFLAKLRAGNYFLKTHFIGYKSTFIYDLKLARNQTLDLNIIGLIPGQQMMDEVRITTGKTTLINRIDKQVYKAEQFQSAQGGTAIDILKNMPSISISGDGQINMRGAAGFQVLLNGKPVSGNPQTILSQLPANAIENIELITAPSARYDAEGKAGIINIITKKGVTQGFSIAINTQGGLPSVHDYDNKNKPVRYGTDATISWKNEKWDLVASGNFHRNNLAGYREGDVHTILNGIKTRFPSNGERSFDRYNYAGRFSAGFSADEKNAWSIGIYHGEKFQARTADLLYQISKTDLTNGDTLDKHTYFNYNLQSKMGVFSLANIDHIHRFSKASSITTSLLFEHANLHGKTENTNVNFPQVSDTIQYTLNPNSNPLQGLRYNLDYARKLESGKLEMGYQYRTDKQEGQFSYLTRNMLTGQLVLDPQFSSSVYSRNKIHAVYSQYSGQVKTISYSAGLRYEYAQRSLQFQNDPNSKVLKLSNLFPSANILYGLSGTVRIKAGFSRRIQRTKNHELNPYPEREHSETLEQGDPNLLPELINLYELGLIKSFSKGSFFTTFYHQQITHPIQRVNKVYNDTILNRVFTNAGEARLWGMEFGGTFRAAQWWQLYSGGNIYQYKIDGNIFNNTIKVSNSSWVYSFNVNSNIQLSDSWSFQLNVNYLSRRPTAQGEDSRFLSPNSSVKKTFTNGKWSVMLQWQNMDMGLLGSNEQRITTHGSNFFTTTNYIYEKDVFMLHFSFNLNQLVRKIKLPASEFGEKEF